VEESSMQTLIDDGKLKQLLKDASIEAIEEKRNVFYELIMDAIKDIAIVRAIREGENSKTVSNQEIFNILEGQA
jgi:hypothetical protein